MPSSSPPSLSGGRLRTSVVRLTASALGAAALLVLLGLLGAAPLGAQARPAPEPQAVAVTPTRGPFAGITLSPEQQRALAALQAETQAALTQVQAGRSGPVPSATAMASVERILAAHRAQLARLLDASAFARYEANMRAAGDAIARAHAEREQARPRPPLQQGLTTAGGTR